MPRFITNNLKRGLDSKHLKLRELFEGYSFKDRDPLVHRKKPCRLTEHQTGNLWGHLGLGMRQIDEEDSYLLRSPSYVLDIAKNSRPRP